MAIGATNDPEVWSEGVLLQAYLGGRSETERLLRSFRTDVTCLYVRRPLRDDVQLERHKWSIGLTNLHGEHNTCGWSVHWPLGDSPGGFGIRRILPVGGVLRTYNSRPVTTFEVEPRIPLASGAFLVPSDGVGALAWEAVLRFMPSMLGGLLSTVRTDTSLRTLPLLLGLANMVKRSELRANGIYVDASASHRGAAAVTAGARFLGAKGSLITVRLNLAGQPLRKSTLHLRASDGFGENDDDVVRLTHLKAAPTHGARHVTVQCTLRSHLVPLRVYELHERCAGGDHVQLLEDVTVHAPVHLEVLNLHFAGAAGSACSALKPYSSAPCPESRFAYTLVLRKRPHRSGAIFLVR